MKALTNYVLGTPFVLFTMIHSMGCGGSDAPPPEYPPLEMSETQNAENKGPVDPAVLAQPKAPPAQASPALEVKVVAGEVTPIEGKKPTVKITAPRQNAMVNQDNVEIKLNVKNWDVATGAKHVHLIIDNEPYIPLYDVSKPINLNELMTNALKKDLTPGTHVLRAFPGHPHHESVKEKGAFAWVVFHYKEKTKDFKFDSKAPLFTYSRPKGCNKVGERVLLDFYLTNVDKLSADGYKVRYQIDGDVSGDITDWKPHYIENLSVGEHTVHLALVGKDAAPTAGPFNDTMRTIQVQNECPPAHPAHTSPTNVTPPGALINAR